MFTIHPITVVWNTTQNNNLAYIWDSEIKTLKNFPIILEMSKTIFNLTLSLLNSLSKASLHISPLPQLETAYIMWIINE